MSNKTAVFPRHEPFMKLDVPCFHQALSKLFGDLFLAKLFSSIVNEVINTISIFLQENFTTQEHITSKNHVTKTKTSEQKTTKTTIFREQKLLRGEKFFILRFVSTENC